MIFTIQRYISKELFKVFALTAIALTLIMSLGTVLRPVQEYGVGPGQVFSLMLYFLPVTLTFVLPVAALFASSLVYGRFAADNEFDACRASGISPMTLIYPGLGLAVLMAICNLLLNFYVTPEFVHRAEKEIKADAKQIIFRNIQRKGFYQPPKGDYLIRADTADLETGILSGVVITDIDKSKIGKIITAENAKVTFNRHQRFNEVHITSRNTAQMGPPGEGGFFTTQMSVSREFGSLMSDSIKFKKIDEIKRIRDINPLRFYPIEKKARDTYSRLIIELLAEDIRKEWSENPEKFYRLDGAGGTVGFNAEKCIINKNGSLEFTGDVVVKDNTSQTPRTLYCSRAFLHIEGDEFAPTLTMEMRSATWKRSSGVEVLSRRPLIYGLLLPGSVTSRFTTSDRLEILKPANISKMFDTESESEVLNLARQLRKEINDTMVTIKAEIHSRLVFGIGCIPMILIGIGLGMIKKEGHLLSAFGTSIIPALVLVLCIISGKQLTKKGDATQIFGVLIMWAGVVFLCVLSLWIYRKLVKN